MQDYAREFYSSTAWKETRAAYAKSKGNLCERCLKEGRITPCEAVHHKIHLNPVNIHDPEISLNWNNLECVCRDCHAKAHGKPMRYKFDELGRVILPPLKNLK